MRFDGQGSVREHILRMADRVYQLRNLKKDLPDDYLVHVAVNSLPREYDTFKVNYNSQDKKWSVNELIAHCVQEEERLKQGKTEYAHVAVHGPKRKNLKRSGNRKSTPGHRKPEQGKAPSTSQTQEFQPQHNKDGATKNKEVECFFCHKKGHIKKNFYRYQEWLKKQGVDKEARS